MRRRSGDLLDQAGPDTAGADVDLLDLAVNDNPLGLQIRVRNLFVAVVRMGNRVADHRSFAAKFA